MPFSTKKILLQKICCFYFVMVIIPSYLISSDQKTHKIKSMDVIKYIYKHMWSGKLQATFIQRFNRRRDIEFKTQWHMLRAQCFQQPQSNRFIQCYRGRNQLTCDYFITGNLWHLAWYVSAYYPFISFCYGLIWLRLSLWIQLQRV